MEYKLLPNSNCTKKCFVINHCKENMLCEKPRKVWNVLVFSGLMIPWWPVSSPTQASENQSTSSKLCFKAALVSRWWNIGILDRCENSCFHWKIGCTKSSLQNTTFLPPFCKHWKLNMMSLYSPQLSLRRCVCPGGEELSTINHTFVQTSH